MSFRAFDKCNLKRRLLDAFAVFNEETHFVIPRRFVRRYQASRYRNAADIPHPHASGQSHPELSPLIVTPYQTTRIRDSAIIIGCVTSSIILGRHHDPSLPL
jgi:hypothetical protein